MYLKRFGTSETVGGGKKKAISDEVDQDKHGKDFETLLLNARLLGMLTGHLSETTFPRDVLKNWHEFQSGKRGPLSVEEICQIVRAGSVHADFGPGAAMSDVGERLNISGFINAGSFIDDCIMKCCGRSNIPKIRSYSVGLGYTLASEPTISIFSTFDRLDVAVGAGRGGAGNETRPLPISRYVDVSDSPSLFSSRACVLLFSLSSGTKLVTYSEQITQITTSDSAFPSRRTRRNRKRRSSPGEDEMQQDSGNVSAGGLDKLLGSSTGFAAASSAAHAGREGFSQFGSGGGVGYSAGARESFSAQTLRSDWLEQEFLSDTNFFPEREGSYILSPHPAVVIRNKLLQLVEGRKGANPAQTFIQLKGFSPQAVASILFPCFSRTFVSKSPASSDSGDDGIVAKKDAQGKISGAKPTHDGAVSLQFIKKTSPIGPLVELAYGLHDCSSGRKMQEFVDSFDHLHNSLVNAYTTECFERKVDYGDGVVMSGAGGERKTRAQLFREKSATSVDSSYLTSQSGGAVSSTAGFSSSDANMEGGEEVEDERQEVVLAEEDILLCEESGEAEYPRDVSGENNDALLLSAIGRAPSGGRHSQEKTILHSFNGLSLRLLLTELFQAIQQFVSQYVVAGGRCEKATSACAVQSLREVVLLYGKMFPNELHPGSVSRPIDSRAPPQFNGQSSLPPASKPRLVFAGTAGPGGPQKEVQLAVRKDGGKDKGIKTGQNKNPQPPQSSAGSKLLKRKATNDSERSGGGSSKKSAKAKSVALSAIGKGGGDGKNAGSKDKVIVKAGASQQQDKSNRPVLSTLTKQFEFQPAGGGPRQRLPFTCKSRVSSTGDFFMVVEVDTGAGSKDFAPQKDASIIGGYGEAEKWAGMWAKAMSAGGADQLTPELCTEWPELLEWMKGVADQEGWTSSASSSAKRRPRKLVEVGRFLDGMGALKK